MRVLFATTHRHLPQGTGGIEVTTDTLCKALQARGAQPAVYCGLHQAGLFGLRRRLERRLSGQDVVEDRHCGYPVFRGWRPVPSAPEVLARFRPDVVVVQGWLCNELAKPFLQAGLPTIISMHTAEPFALDAELAQARRLAFVANSRFTASLHADKDVIAVIPPLIVRPDYAVETDRTTALFVNPLRAKGLPTVLELARRRPDARFEVYESWRIAPEERREALARCAELPNIRWRAAVSDMRIAYRQARVVLMPSDMETWGRMASEGHISGIPTLASTRGALPDTVGPGGLCVPLDAPAEAWAAAFSTLWDESAAYGGFREAAEAFSRRDEIQVDQVIDRFAGVLEAVAGRA